MGILTNKIVKRLVFSLWVSPPHRTDARGLVGPGAERVENPVIKTRHVDGGTHDSYSKFQDWTKKTR